MELPQRPEQLHTNPVGVRFLFPSSCLTDVETKAQRCLFVLRELQDKVAAVHSVLVFSLLLSAKSQADR